MQFFRTLLGTKEEQPVLSYSDFWNYFSKHAHSFFKVVQNRGNIENDFFEKLSPKVNVLGIPPNFLTGMFDVSTAELIITADGDVTKFVLVEELIAAAPKIVGWRFTSLKPEISSEGWNISMGGYAFGSDDLKFYPVDNPDTPDEVDIVLVHKDCNEENKEQIKLGTFVFLENYLGELNLATTVDNVTVVGPDEAENELIDLTKLKGYLLWRQKEFIEKYEGARHDTENDTYILLEATTKEGLPIVATVNKDILGWDSKASHPWILIVTIAYNVEGRNGMPDETVSASLYDLEDEIMQSLKDHDGYLNIARETGGGNREIYFAYKEFRKPSKVLHELIATKKVKWDVTYTIYKDKYWLSFRRFDKTL